MHGKWSRPQAQNDAAIAEVNSSDQQHHELDLPQHGSQTSSVFMLGVFLSMGGPSTQLNSVVGPCGKPVKTRMHPIALSLCEPVTSAIVQRQKTLFDAIMLCLTVSGKDRKAVYFDLAIDKGHWSRILDGKAHFPIDKLERLMDLCGNDIPLQWLAWRRCKGLHPLESENQRIMRDKDARIAELEQKLEWTRELVRR